MTKENHGVLYVFCRTQGRAIAGQPELLRGTWLAEGQDDLFKATCRPIQPCSESYKFFTVFTGVTALNIASFFAWCSTLGFSPAFLILPWMFGLAPPYILARNAKKTIGVLRVAEVMTDIHKNVEKIMYSTCDDCECAVDLVAEMFMVNMNTAHDIWNMVDRVVRICLCKHVGHDSENDVSMIKKIIMNKLRDEIAMPTYFDNLERCSVQTCVVVLSREIALDYIRNAHYSRSSVSDIFRCMNVNVSGAEEYLDGLDDMFSPSQKCVLRLLYGEGCTVHQAANMLGVSSDEVLTLQWQAMERLQQEWRLMKTGGAYQ